MAKSKKSKAGRPAAPRPKASKKPPVYPVDDVYTLSDLDQVRVLADPLRVRILEALCQERTTKQVAEAIGEKPTKLYHHVEALERVGLIRITRTRPNRGTLEKYFLAVAKTFRTDSRLFAGASGDGPETEALQAITATAFDRTGAELREVIERGTTDLETEGAVCYAEIRASAKVIKRLQTKIDKLLAEIQKSEPDDDGQVDERRYRFTLAFFPLDKK